MIKTPRKISLILSSILLSVNLSRNVLNINEIDNRDKQVIDLKEINSKKAPYKWLEEKISYHSNTVYLYDLLSDILPEDKTLNISQSIIKHNDKMLIPSLKVKDKSLYQVLEQAKELFNVFIDYKEDSISVNLQKHKTFHLPLSNSINNSTSISIGANPSDESGGSNRNISTEATLTNETFQVMIDNLNNMLRLKIEMNTELETPYLFANEATGVITVNASYELLNTIENYIESIIEANSQTLLIEVKVVKFSNTSSQAYGIQWNRVFEKLNVENWGTLQTNISKIGVGDTTNSISSSVPFSGGYETLAITLGSSINPTAIIKALDAEGNVETVAEPTLRVTNNQSTTLFSGTVKNYVASISSTKSDDGDTETTMDIGTIEEGFNLTIKPRYNKETDNIELFMVPVLNNVLAMNEASSSEETVKLPIIDSRSINISTKVKNGETLILAGLKEKGTSKNRTGIPILNKVPVLKNFFGYKESFNTENELVIILKATVLK